MTGPGRRGGQGGATLVEIAVVLAVVGVLASLSLSSLQRWKEKADLRNAASKVAELMLTARMKAVVERREYTVSVDYAADTCRVTPGLESMQRRASVDLYADTGDPEVAPLTDQNVVFRANGTADAAGFEAVSLRSRSPWVTSRYRVKVLGATGKVSVERWMEGSWVPAN